MDDTAERTDGDLSRGFLAVVGQRIREARSSRGLTMQQLADRAEISRRLLTQIELGQANPSLVTVTRIARQLGTDFTSLLAPADADAAVEVVAPDQHLLVWSTPAGSSAHLLVATRGERTADLWSWVLEPDEQYVGRSDAPGSQELFCVLEGELTIETDGRDHVVVAGAACRLLSDRAYTYANRSGTRTRFLRTVALAPRT